MSAGITPYVPPTKPVTKAADPTPDAVEVLPDYQPDYRTVSVGKDKVAFGAYREVLVKCPYFAAACKKEWKKGDGNLTLPETNPSTFRSLLHYLYTDRLIMPIQPTPNRTAKVEEKTGFYEQLIEMYCLAQFLGHIKLCDLVVERIKAFEHSTDHRVSAEAITTALESVPSECSLIQLFAHQFATLEDSVLDQQLDMVPFEFVKMVTRFACKQWSEAKDYRRSFEQDAADGVQPPSKKRKARG